MLKPGGGSKLAKISGQGLGSITGLCPTHALISPRTQNINIVNFDIVRSLVFVEQQSNKLCPLIYMKAYLLRFIFTLIAKILYLVS